MTFCIPRKRTRRAVLRGILNGGAVTLALPFLDCVLNENGTALAATGKPLPVRFGTWYWGMGHTPGHAIAEKRVSGPGIGFLKETESLKKFERYLNFFGGFQMPLDGRSNYTHFTGWVGSRTGAIPSRQGEIPAPTLDLLIADVIGNKTRFKTINASSSGIARENYSARSTDSRPPAEVSPVALYARLFGADFVDPNAAQFTPDPAVMLEKSALSAFMESSRDYMKTIGAADRARLDEYFTSVRQIENQLALQLKEPEPNDACVLPPRPREVPADQAARSREMPNVIETHKVMAKLLALAVACDQTRVFNMVFTDNFANVRRPGEANTHHLLTHNEVVDPALGYQKQTFWFNQQCSEGFATFLETLASVREGSGTLLDNSLIFATSETAYAKLHTIDGIPMWLAGRAGGRMKTGWHLVGGGDPVTRVGLTAMKIMGVPIQDWGQKSLKTARPLNEIVGSVDEAVVAT
jgi:hypothetical protein